MTMAAFDRHHANPDNWKLAIFYFCREDQRIIVPKRIRGLGWTLNLARPLALPCLAFLIALIHGVLELAGALGSGRDAIPAIKLLVVLGAIAVSYRLVFGRKKATQVSKEEH